VCVCGCVSIAWCGVWWAVLRYFKLCVKRANTNNANALLVALGLPLVAIGSVLVYLIYTCMRVDSCTCRLNTGLFHGLFPYIVEVLLRNPAATPTSAAGAAPVPLSPGRS
jgi:hypothetical protein